jgi:hypothetical protein
VQLDQHATIYSVAQSNGDVAFSFTTTNVTHRPLTYRWDLTMAATGSPPVAVRTGTFDLAAGAGRQVPVRTRITDCTRRTEIVVAVSSGSTGPVERISFWVEPATLSLSLREGRATCGIVK